MLEQCRHCPSQLAHPFAVAASRPSTRGRSSCAAPTRRQVWYERVPTAAVKRLDRVLKEARTELEKYLEEIDRIDFQDRGGLHPRP